MLEQVGVFKSRTGIDNLVFHIDVKSLFLLKRAEARSCCNLLLDHRTQGMGKHQQVARGLCQPIAKRDKEARLGHEADEQSGACARHSEDVAVMQHHTTPFPAH